LTPRSCPLSYRFRWPSLRPCEIPYDFLFFWFCATILIPAVFPKPFPPSDPHERLPLPIRFADPLLGHRNLDFTAVPGADGGPGLPSYGQQLFSFSRASLTTDPFLYMVLSVNHLLYLPAILLPHRGQLPFSGYSSCFRFRRARWGEWCFQVESPERILTVYWSLRGPSRASFCMFLNPSTLRALLPS